MILPTKTPSQAEIELRTFRFRGRRLIHSANEAAMPWGSGRYPGLTDWRLLPSRITVQTRKIETASLVEFEHVFAESLWKFNPVSCPSIFIELDRWYEVQGFKVNSIFVHSTGLEATPGGPVADDRWRSYWRLTDLPAVRPGTRGRPPRPGAKRGAWLEWLQLFALLVTLLWRQKLPRLELTAYRRGK